MLKEKIVSLLLVASLGLFIVLQLACFNVYADMQNQNNTTVIYTPDNPKEDKLIIPRNSDSNIKY
ncbi:hypothetical protein PFZ79_002615, partial [Enterococcus hirae]|nr:hypothetical protein [Enterococcus hirae]